MKLTGSILKVLSMSVLSSACATVTKAGPVEFQLLHYNVKELNSEKLLSGDGQLEFVKKVISQKGFEILSLNEVQYDLPGVPGQKYQSSGQNLEKLKRALDLPSFWNTSFNPANTGMNALKDQNGNYVLDPSAPGARDLADQVNFGTMPAQYSTGAVFSYPKQDELIISDLTWKEFNPSVDLSKFTDAKGEPLPKDIKLFDKNFSDVTLNVAGKELHLVLLHTVPSFHFGNMRSPNYERNRDQLRFLEWYLTGVTDIAVELKHITPITGASFVAVGDFNADINDPKSPGGNVLKNLFEKTNLWIDQDELSFSNEGSSYAPAPFRLMLDYIVTSKNVLPLEGEILHPSFQRIELGCGDNTSRDARSNMVRKTYLKEGETCAVLIPKEYETYKNASDHYPLWGRFQIN